MGYSWEKCVIKLSLSLEVARVFGTALATILLPNRQAFTESFLKASTFFQTEVGNAEKLLEPDCALRSFEKWNMLFTIAMTWHVVAMLKPGGQLCMNGGIFRVAETRDLVSLLSALFD